ncbi:metallophosphoesterase family protein [Methyloraptor flagellatus]|uniref:Metallophosphoesterase n=1 Tax=Methyloraptor flagellatus TaxID=3162530 RepID=A0AAU7XAK4_9HYPH
MFRLAHISDPHLGPLPEPRLRELIGKRVLGYLNWRLNRGRGGMRPAVLDALVADLRAHAPDHVAVTGDIVNIALDAELEPARQWIASLGSPHDVSVVPGNHDAYVPGALHRATESWGDYMCGDDGDIVRFPSCAGAAPSRSSASRRRSPPVRSWRPAISTPARRCGWPNCSPISAAKGSTAPC